MALQSDLDTWTTLLPDRAEEADRAIALSRPEDTHSVASNEIGRLASDLIEIRRSIQRELTVPIHAPTLDRLRRLVFAIADAISGELLGTGTVTSRLLAPNPVGITAPFGALAALEDDAAEIADEISALKPLAEHYFNRDVREHRKERTTDVVSIEADAVTAPQLEVKRNIVEFLRKTSDALSGAVASLEQLPP